MNSFPITVTPPLVSAIMVTGHDPARHWLAEVAFNCFLKQCHPTKELIIINHGHAPFYPPKSNNITIIDIPAELNVTLGELRNIGLAHARGEWIIQWDDDDWYASDRITLQLVNADSVSVNLLEAQLRYDFIHNTAIRVSYLDGIPGTLLHHRKLGVKYPLIEKGEDSAVLTGFPHRILPNFAGVYIRSFHERNTWGRHHIMGYKTGIFNQFSISDAELLTLTEDMLPTYHRGYIRQNPITVFDPLLNWVFLDCDVRSRGSKVFGIGLPFSDMSILSSCLFEFGMHIIEHPIALFFIDNMECAIGESVSLYFDRLDRLYPDSLFIYIRPDFSIWLSSYKKESEAQVNLEFHNSDFSDTIKAFLLQSNDPSPAELERAYKLFDMRVTEYFSNRHNLLTIDPYDKHFKILVDQFVFGNQ